MFYAIASAILNSLNSVKTKSIVQSMDFREGICFSMLCSTILAFIIAIFNWDLKIGWITVCIVLTTSIAQLITISIGNYLIREQGITGSNIYLRLNLLVVCIIDFLTVPNGFTITRGIGILCFLAGIFLFCTDGQVKSFLISKRNSILVAVNILLFSIRPYMIKIGYQLELFNSVTVTFLNFGLITFYAVVIFRVNIIKKISNLKQCMDKSVIKTLSTVFYNKAMDGNDVSMVQAFSSLDIIISPLMGRYFHSEKITYRYKWAMVLIFVAVILIRR